MATYMKEVIDLAFQNTEKIFQNDLYDSVNVLLLDYVKQFTCVRQLNMAVCDLSDFMSCRVAKIGINLGKKYFDGEYITAGSRGEGLGLLSNDKDTICINNNISVVLPGKNVEPTEDDLIIDTGYCHPGYCRLKFHRLNRRNVDTFGNEVKQIGREWFLKTSCMANSYKKGNQLFATWDSRGPALSLDLVRQDFVLALRCNSEQLMHEYLCRGRVWPDNERLQIMKKTVPCTVVATVHHESLNPDIEYRFSFAQAERFLIRNMNFFQFAVYVLLKQIKPCLEINISNTDVIRSYYIKTVLLWTCESIPSTEWSESSFLRNCLSCLEILKFCYRDGILPSVFVPQNNLFDQYNKQTLSEAYFMVEYFVKIEYFLKYVLESLCKDTFEGFEHILHRMHTRTTDATLRRIFAEKCTSSYPLDRINIMMECETLAYSVINGGLIDPEVQMPLIFEVKENIHHILGDYPVEYRICLKTLLKRYFGDYVHTHSKSLRGCRARCLALYEDSVELCMPISMINDQNISGKIHISLFHYLNGDLLEACDAIFSIEQKILCFDIVHDVFYTADFTIKDRHATDPFLFSLFSKTLRPGNEIYFCVTIKYLALAMYILSNCVYINTKRHVTKGKVVQYRRKTLSCISCLKNNYVDNIYHETMDVLLKSKNNFLHHI